MRLHLLILALGLVAGFALHSLVIAHPNWLPNFAVVSQPATNEVNRPYVASTKPHIYPSPEKTLSRLQQKFDEAVVVVLADESYDDHHQLIKVTVREVWKGPQNLVGQTMSSRLEAPMSYTHPKGTERVLRFMPMTPHLDTVGSIFFEGDALRMNPVITVTSLREALIAHSSLRVAARLN